MKEFAHASYFIFNLNLIVKLIILYTCVHFYIILYFRYEVYMKKPGKLENSYFYVDIYPEIAWIGTFLVLLIIPFIVWMFYRLDNRFKVQRKYTALIDGAFDIMTALANQGE